jgi:poly(3-hydroxybutyrate) depolymerase
MSRFKIVMLFGKAKSILQPYVAVAAALLVASSATAQVAPLPALGIDKRATTVSGISSGGYMAVQLAVAHSSVFGAGFASIAGGPYDCAEGSLFTALGRCLGRAPIPDAALAARTQKLADEGAIDPLRNLSATRAYVFSGAKDSAVAPATSEALVAYLKRVAPNANVVYKSDVAAEHAFVTDDHGPSCLTKGVPYVVDCDFDLAGALLGHLLGGLNPRIAPKDTSLVRFNQRELSAEPSLADAGWVYIPDACRSEGAQCRVHVALHGCKQNEAEVGDAFFRHAGYNRWAESNRIVVVYPQTGRTATNGCWDWWGYASADYAKKTAPQMRAIVAMVDALAVKPQATPKR